MKTGLIMEGGAMRGMFTAGVLDVLMENGLVTDGAIGVVDLLILGRLAASRGEARRLIEQGGISVDGERVEQFNTAIPAERLAEGIKVKKGKKIFHKFITEA